jgi:aspartate/methionine/tyrosine aminotransferase
MQNLDQWLAGERDEILTRRAAITEHMPILVAKGWRLLGLGGYFAYFYHPYAMSSADLAPEMVKQIGVLSLPGTMFFPPNDPAGASQMRIAFANLDAVGIKQLIDRMATLDLPRR